MLMTTKYVSVASISFITSDGYNQILQDISASVSLRYLQVNVFRIAAFSFLHDSSSFCFGSWHYKSPGARIKNLYSSLIPAFYSPALPVTCLVLGWQCLRHIRNISSCPLLLLHHSESQFLCPNFYYRTDISQQMWRDEPEGLLMWK